MSKKKILTPAIVREKLEEEDGIIFGLEGDDAQKILLEDWGGTLDTSSDWADGKEDLIIYTENTADSYEVFICTDNHDNNPYWDQDVYYYEAHEEWMERVIDTLRDGGAVWISTYMWDSMEYEAETAWTYAYEDWFSEKFDEKKEELMYETEDYGEYQD